MEKVALMYHDIITINDITSGFQNESAFQYKVNEDTFEEVVRNLSPSRVLFTFDDGGLSFLTNAAPILEKYGHRGVFFIATDYIGTPGFLSVEQVRELDKRGHIVGSHSCSHPHNMAGLPDDAISKEWIESKNKLEEILGHTMEYASIPNGYSSKSVVTKAREAGIKYLYTSTPIDRVKNVKGISLIGRYVIHDKMLPQEVTNIVESRKTRIKKYAKWLVIESIKFVLGNQYDKVKSIVVSTSKN